MPQWAAAKAAVAAGTGNARIACIGDSITVGYQALATGYTGAHANSWPTKLSALLSHGSWQSWFSFGSGTASVIEADARLTKSASWTSGGALPPIAYLTEGTPNVTLLTFTPTTDVDTFELHYIQVGAASGVLTWNVDGGADSTINTAGGSTIPVAVALSAGSLGPHTLNLHWSSAGAVFVQGVIAYNSAQKEVSVINLGASGTKAADWVTNTAAWYPPRMVPGLLPDLSILNLTVNDTIAGTALATFQTNTQTIIDYLKSNGGDVILASGTPIGSSSDAVQAQYRQVYIDLATANGLNFINLYAAFGGSYAAAAAAGYMYTDTVHVLAAGEQVMANSMAAIL